jgi:hypothetical protein
MFDVENEKPISEFDGKSKESSDRGYEVKIIYWFSSADKL